MKSPAMEHGRVAERVKVKALYEQHLSAYQEILQKRAQDVRLILEQQGLFPTIKCRVKSFDAYFEKLGNQGAASDRRKATVSDFFGLRIVCPFLEDVETVASLLATHFEILETQRKASQHSFREFGYDSVHLAVRLDTRQGKALLPGLGDVCEIQLRTILQDAWAEVEHELVYKSDITLPNQSIRRKLASLNATLTLSDLIFQEIRDYQKELRQHGRKRRASVERATYEQGAIAISHPTTAQADARLGPVPSTLASHLEKTMLRALEAHSNHDLDHAIALYGQLLGMQLDRKTRGLVYNHRGMAYFAMAQHRHALKDFSSAIRYDPQSDRGHANRGLCYRVLKKYARALEDFNRALQINPNRADSYFGRAQTCSEMGEFQQAVDDCEKALAIHSGYQPARQLIKTLQGDVTPL